MKSSNRVAKLRREVERKLIDPIEAECREKRYYANQNGGNPVVYKTFDQLEEMTGWSFRSDTEARGALYDIRVRIAEERAVFFDAVHGQGLKFTTDRAIGSRWYIDLSYKIQKAYEEKQRKLLEAAAENAHKTPISNALAGMAEKTRRDYHALTSRYREYDTTFRTLEREGDIAAITEPDEPFENGEHADLEGQEVLECSSCGEVWLRETARGRKPGTCPDCG